MKQLQVYKLRMSQARRSEILTESMLVQLGANVPPLVRMKTLDLVFSISSDGVSMRTFYGCLAKYNPTIVLVEDTKGHVFGAYATESWHDSTRFYGTGESFLFKFNVRPRSITHG
ncbi:MAG: TLD domain-containing protein [Candidatus Pacebacteria bacterium]|nr:TLD domain-containing protein [Candidatus Paceibacterota bacterium]